MVAGSTGFSNRANAPFAMTFARRAAVGNAVTKMVGGAQPNWRRRACISTPDIRGIRTSEMRHDVSVMYADWRNASGEENIFACQPSERIKAEVAAQRAASSSTMEIT